MDPLSGCWPHWEKQLEKARREGVIEGLERALSCFPAPNSTTQWDPQDEIRAEIAKLKDVRCRDCGSYHRRS